MPLGRVPNSASQRFSRIRLGIFLIELEHLDRVLRLFEDIRRMTCIRIDIAILPVFECEHGVVAVRPEKCVDVEVSTGLPFDGSVPSNRVLWELHMVQEIKKLAQVFLKLGQYAFAILCSIARLAPKPINNSQ